MLRAPMQSACAREKRSPASGTSAFTFSQQSRMRSMLLSRTACTCMGQPRRAVCRLISSNSLQAAPEISNGSRPSKS
ncbi:MAG: hypothetical protein JWP40_3806 [Blastococcus sp.]|jgi:hypothetical protein|nr:hypothetical protein [Blastococcus sp.]